MRTRLVQDAHGAGALAVVFALTAPGVAGARVGERVSAPARVAPPVRRTVQAPVAAVSAGRAEGAGGSPERPLPGQDGDAIPDAAVQRSVLDASYAYFAAKDAGRYDAAYAAFADSLRAYLTRDLFAAQAVAFNTGAGRGGERRIVRLTWERDPADAPAPGLYVAADFVSRFPNLRLHCGYLMWHREADGRFRIVREEQSFLDEAAARRMTPETLAPLPRRFGCPAAGGPEPAGQGRGDRRPAAAG